MTPTHPAPPTTPAAVPTNASSPHHPAQPSRPRRPRVLLVDDSTMIHRLVQAWLSAECDVICCADARASVDLAVGGDFALVLLDVQMPGGIDGFELCRLLKQDPRTLEVPIVFLSGATSPAERIRGLELGAVDYVNKPFDPAEFQARVRAALRTKRLIDLLGERSRLDALTELHNRAYLDERLPSLLSLARRTGRAVSCVMIDVDDMRGLNARHGHAFGDATLRRLATTLAAMLRREDVLCRWAGEEFVVVTPDIDAEGAAVLAGRLREATAGLELDALGGRSARVTCSFGVAQYEPEAAERAVLLRADEAMRQAKAAGGDRVATAKPTPARAAA